MSDNSSPASLKWNQHPVIATVLWILGTETTTSGNNETDRNSNYSSQGKLNVIWKDEQGGNINEYFTQVQSHTSQSSASAMSSSNSRNAAPQLLPSAFQQPQQSNMLETPPTSSFSSGGMKRTSAASSSLSQQNTADNSSIPVDMTTPSPQWGFYVAITPPQQESYARQSESASS